MRASDLQNLADRIAVLEGKAPVSRVVREVESRVQVREVRAVQINVPAEPGVVLFDGSFVAAVFVALALRSFAAWVVRVYRLGVAAASR